MLTREQVTVPVIPIKRKHSSCAQLPQTLRGGGQGFRRRLARGDQSSVPVEQRRFRRIDSDLAQGTWRRSLSRRGGDRDEASGFVACSHRTGRNLRIGLQKSIDDERIVKQ